MFVRACAQERAARVLVDFASLDDRFPGEISVADSSPKSVDSFSRKGVDAKTALDPVRVRISLECVCVFL